MNDQALGRALRKLADEIEGFSPSVIGEQVSVSVTGPGSGTIVGKSISVTVGAGNHGDIVGSRTSVVVGPRDPEELRLVQELRQEAAKVDSGAIDQSQIKGFLQKAGSVASAAVTPVTRGVVQALMESS